MNDLSLFFADKAQEEESTFYVATKRFKDKDGNPVPWEIRAISTEADEALLVSVINIPKTSRWKNICVKWQFLVRFSRT